MIPDTTKRSYTVGKLPAEDIDLHQMCYQVLESDFPLPDEVNGFFDFFKISENICSVNIQLFNRPMSC